MKINLITVGKTKPEFINCINDYEKRLPKYCKYHILTIKEKKSTEQEAKEILPKIKGYTIVLTEEGTQQNSEQLAELIKNKNEITFIIGSHQGLSNKIKTKANILLSLTKMTLPHQIARLILTEQIYRALTINKNEKYHK